MPEGDTIFRAAARLDAALAGAELTHGELDVPRHATTDLTGALVREVVPRGKHLLMRMLLREDELTLHSHLRMDGSWRLVPAASHSIGVPAFEVRALLRTREWTAVGHLLGEVDLVRTRDEHTVVGHLGPDLLDPQFDRALALANLAAVPSRHVAEALREQRTVAGLGNELVTEVCFLRGVSPWTPVGDIDLDATLTLAQRLIRANATRSVRSSTGDLRPGRTAYVYHRSGKACRRCGERIRSARHGTGPTARTSWWCPRCQPGPGPGTA